MPLSFNPAQHSSLSEKVKDELRRAIWEYRLKPGERIVEADVAAQMQVSRGPVREALQALAGEGIVQIHPRQGATVAIVSSQDLWEAWTLRINLERYAVKLAMERITESDLDRLQSIVDERRDALGTDYNRVVSCDYEFHESIIRMAGHKRLYESWLGTSSIIRLSLSSMSYVKDDRGQEIQHEHQRIVDLMRSGNVAECEELMVTHAASTVKKFLGLEIDHRPLT